MARSQIRLSRAELQLICWQAASGSISMGMAQPLLCACLCVTRDQYHPDIAGDQALSAI